MAVPLRGSGGDDEIKDDEMLILDGHTSAVYALAFSPDSYWLASGAKDGTVLAHDPAGGAAEVFSTRPDPAACTCLAFDAQSRLLVGRGAAVFRGDPAAPKTFLSLTEVQQKGDTPTGIALVGENLVAVGYGDRARKTSGVLVLFDATSNTLRPNRTMEPYGVQSVAAHPPTRTVAWSNGSRRVTVWDIVKPDPVHFSLRHTSAAVAFHPDGTLLAVAQEWDAKVLDVARRAEVVTLTGHKGKVTSVAFSPDGRTLATGSWDGTVRLWDPYTGAERQAFQWPTGKVYAVAFAPDGTRAAAAGEKGTIVVWDTE